VVCDPLRIRLGEPDENVGREVEPLHASTLAGEADSGEREAVRPNRLHFRLIRELRGRAAHGPLVENPLAVAADLLLDLVGDPGVLAQCVGGHGPVLVDLACPSAEVLGHCSLTLAVAGPET
jgi:hypothetical protein